MPVFDLLNQLVEIGSIICYPRQKELALGKVLDLVVIQHTTLPAYNNYHIVIKGIMAGDDSLSIPPRLNQKKSILHHPSNILVVNPNQVPVKYRRLLDSI